MKEQESKKVFTRYVMEKNDIGMEEWMKRKLSKEDYDIYSKR